MRKIRKPHPKRKLRKSKRAAKPTAPPPTITADTRIDFGDRKLAQYFPAELLGSAFKKVFPQLETTLKEVKRRFVSAPDQALPDSTISAYLDACREAVEGDLIRKAQRFSSLQWLYYLRGVPFSYWSGEQPSTGLYDAQLAEIISAKSTRQGGLVQRAAGLGDFRWMPASKALLPNSVLV